MKKILLISTNQVTTPYPVPPLGLACLYQRLKSKYRVKVVDGLEKTTSRLIDSLEAFEPDYLGISIRNVDDMVKGAAHSFMPSIIDDFIVPLRRNHQGVLILGGSGFSIFPHQLMALSGADYGIVGEGEENLIRLLACMENNQSTSALPGVVTGAAGRSEPKGGAYLPLTQPFHAELDELLDYSPYLGRSAYPIQTKRGCVHRCIYCSYPILEGRQYRKRNVDQVVDEIEATLERLGPKINFEFVDSTFNDPPGHGEAICRGIIKRGLQVKLRTMGINPANVSDQLLSLMKEAGFSQIDSTPDSGSPVVLKKMGKNFSLQQLQRSAGLIAKHQMPTMWFFIFGGPGESRQTVAETFDFIDNYIDSEDMVHITEGLRIYPHTPLYKLALKENIISKEESLLDPSFYLSANMGELELEQLISREIAKRPNCIRVGDSLPPPELMAAAMRERAEKGLEEPMFRTLLRLKNQLGL